MVALVVEALNIHVSATAGVQNCAPYTKYQGPSYITDPGGILPYKGLMGTCGQPGYVFRDFCLKQGIEFIIFCLNQGIDLPIFVLNRISFLGQNSKIFTSSNVN